MKLIFRGIVQGVGFRPTIYRIAKKLDLRGYVLNKGSEVEVVIDKKTDVFIKLLKKELPPIAKITDILKFEDNGKFDDFNIIQSSDGERQSLIPYDIATCDKCVSEIFGKKDRRANFPFTNCTVCGGRFSLIEDLPYDRARTSMRAFELCVKCKSEYEAPLNRRYHAQTISCPVCGPKYYLYDSDKSMINSENPIREFAERIDYGEIGVIKSWGGMHLCCKIGKIKYFRKWYNRPEKPFAVMVKDTVAIKKYAEINNDEKNLLLSDKRPIVLVKKKKKLEDISPGIDTIGLFLPYTGLHHMLFSFIDSDALVMTSANIPGEPMVVENNRAFELGADFYLLHNRNIPNRIDDSVITLWNHNKFFIRKSRGYVPEPIDVDYKLNIISVGADQNITGSLSNNCRIFTTQYIGNSKYYETLEFLEKGLKHLMKLTMKNIAIDAVALDMHPSYDSRKVAKIFSEELHTQIYEVQHHHAHAASLLVDNGIDESVVLTLDGLGYGLDGNYWGGEVLFSCKSNFDRVAHLEYIPLLGGDQATIDPRRLVYAIFNKYDVRKFFDGFEADVFDKIIKKSPLSSSLGRILDAISCYLDICTKRTYDGEPAMKLEKFLSKGKNTYDFELEIKDNKVYTTDLFRQIDEKINGKLSEKQKADISYSMVKKIVDSLTNIAIEYADDNDINTIGVSGGVSYNIPIVEMINENVIKNKLKFIVHNQVPNGDGGVSIGQNIVVGSKLTN